ncbi:MAG: sulfite exporter TauE/SafE family protein [Pseudomonadota bacterium]
MQPLIDAFLALQTSPSLIPAMLAIGVAGLVRGFAGFGGAMIFMPFASFLFEPSLAVVTFFLMDSLVTTPLVWNAFKKWDPKTVLPCVIGAWGGVGFGAYLLATTDALVLRWLICGIIILVVVIMISGLKYTRRPMAPISLGVGGVAGVLGGVSQVSGPPVVAYWISGPFPAAQVRANMITFFFLSSVGSAIAFVANGVVTTQSIGLSAWLGPVYGLAIFAGAYFFKGANDALFRRVAFAMIVIAAITSLPLLDPILRG